MVLHHGKCFIFLAVFGLLIFSQTAAAQIIVSGGNSSGENNPAETPVEKASAPELIALNEANVSDDIKLDEAEVEVSRIAFRTEIKDIKYRFRKVESNERTFDFSEAAAEELKRSANRDAGGEPRYIRETAPGRGFNYRGAFTQSLLFLAVQHGYATTQPKTREALKHGAFFRDYADSVKNLRGWDDGGRFFTNYIAHPMQGALTGHIYVQNSPQALREQFSMSGKYWSTRMKAFLWTTAWSTQFEIGPISQASIGNVGLKGKQTWEDIIVTPTMGTAMLIGEDAIDRYVIKNVERNTNNFYVKVLVRMLLNPTRNFSNLLRFREPWYRDRATAR